ncbi:MAG: RNA-binding protein [Gammaproteobacteria bacterium]|jgi:hypothetical protein|nr:RNA-binding protein [Gammaproteobacteria bacterium]
MGIKGMNEKKLNISYQSLQTMANDSATQWHALHQQVAALGVLQKRVLQILPGELSSHCRVTRWQQGQLTIAVNDAAAITGLRYNSAGLRDQLRQLPEFSNLTQIHFKVIPLPDEKPITATHHETQEIKQARILSSSAKTLLKEAISDLNTNPAAAKLTEALSKLTGS